MALPIISLIIAFSIGLSCSLMPCCLPVLLGYLGFLMIEGKEPTKLESILIGITFAVGMLAAIITIGIIFSFIGGISSQIYEGIRYIAIGILILLGLSYLLGYEPEIPFIKRMIEEKGYKAALIQGAIYGIGTSDCAVLMLSTLILYSFTIPSIWINVTNFISFGIGRATPLMVVSPLTLESKQRFIKLFKKHPRIFGRLLPGLLILTAGVTVLISSLLGM